MLAVLARLKQDGVELLVAPYEADAQVCVNGYVGVRMGGGTC